MWTFGFGASGRCSPRARVASMRGPDRPPQKEKPALDFGRCCATFHRAY